MNFCAIWKFIFQTDMTTRTQHHTESHTQGYHTHINRFKEHNEPFDIRGTVRVDHVKLCCHDFEIEALPQAKSASLVSCLAILMCLA